MTFTYGTDRDGSSHQIETENCSSSASWPAFILYYIPKPWSGSRTFTASTSAFTLSFTSYNTIPLQSPQIATLSPPFQTHPHALTNNQDSSSSSSSSSSNSKRKEIAKNQTSPAASFSSSADKNQKSRKKEQQKSSFPATDVKQKSPESSQKAPIINQNLSPSNPSSTDTKQKNPAKNQNSLSSPLSSTAIMQGQTPQRTSTQNSKSTTNDSTKRDRFSTAPDIVNNNYTNSTKRDPVQMEPKKSANTPKTKFSQKKKVASTIMKASEAVSQNKDSMVLPSPRPIPSLRATNFASPTPPPQSHNSGSSRSADSSTQISSASKSSKRDPVKLDIDASHPASQQNAQSQPQPQPQPQDQQQQLQQQAEQPSWIKQIPTLLQPDQHLLRPLHPQLSPVFSFYPPAYPDLFQDYARSVLKEKVPYFMWSNLSKVRPGCLLISNTFLLQHNSTFLSETVLFVHQHSEEDGTLATILNRPRNCKVNDMPFIKNTKILAVYGDYDVYYGGHMLSGNYDYDELDPGYSSGSDQTDTLSYSAHSDSDSNSSFEMPDDNGASTVNPRAYYTSFPVLMYMYHGSAHNTPWSERITNGISHVSLEAVSVLPNNYNDPIDWSRLTQQNSKQKVAQKTINMGSNNSRIKDRKLKNHKTMASTPAANSTNTLDDVVPTEGMVRIFSGVEGWTPGKLQEEVDRGLWTVFNCPPEVVLAPSQDLWNKILYGYSTAKDN